MLIVKTRILLKTLLLNEVSESAIEDIVDNVFLNETSELDISVSCFETSDLSLDTCSTPRRNSSVTTFDPTQPTSTTLAKLYLEPHFRSLADLHREYLKKCEERFFRVLLFVRLFLSMFVCIVSPHKDSINKP